MRLLDRYLFRELLIPLAYCLGGFLLFWISFDLFTRFGKLQDARLRPIEIVEFYLVQCPDFIVLILPVALLLALLYCLTNHARHNELTAMRAAGISLWRICLPYFAVGLASSAVLFVLNEFYVPDSSDKADEILERHVAKPGSRLGPKQVKNLGFTNSRQGRIWLIPIYNYETGEMTRPDANWAEADGTRTWLRAQRGVYTNDVWTFYNVQLYRELPNTNAPLIPILATNLLAMPDFSETIEQIRSEIRIGNSGALRSAKKADIPISEILHYLRLHPNPTQASWIYTKLHGRLAAPWTCLVVVLIAVPFGAPSGRRNVFFGVAGSIFICVVYLFLQQIALAVGASGRIPPWLAGWLPNLTFGAMGIWLTQRTR